MVISLNAGVDSWQGSFCSLLHRSWALTCNSHFAPTVLSSLHPVYKLVPVNCINFVCAENML